MAVGLAVTPAGAPWAAPSAAVPACWVSALIVVASTGVSCAAFGSVVELVGAPGAAPDPASAEPGAPVAASLSSDFTSRTGWRAIAMPSSASTLRTFRPSRDDALASERTAVLVLFGGGAFWALRRSFALAS